MEKYEVLSEVIRNRRSVRSFSNKPISQESIEKLLDAGRWAPTPSNVQSWRFVVIQSSDHIEILKNLSPGFPKEATLAIAICSDQRDMENFGKAEVSILRAEEGAMAAQNMMLVAYSLGLGSCCVASFSATGISTLLELPDYIQPVLLIALGYPKKTPSAPERQKLSKITSWEVYQEDLDE